MISAKVLLVETGSSDRSRDWGRALLIIPLNWGVFPRVEIVNPIHFCLIVGTFQIPVPISVLLATLCLIQRVGSLATTCI